MKVEVEVVLPEFDNADFVLARLGETRIHRIRLCLLRLVEQGSRADVVAAAERALWSLASAVEEERLENYIDEDGTVAVEEYENAVLAWLTYEHLAEGVSLDAQDALDTVVRECNRWV